MKQWKLPLLFLMILFNIGMLTTGCVTEEKHMVMQNTDTNVVQYKDEYTVPLTDQSMIENIKTYVSKSRETNKDLGESLFKVIHGDQTYIIHRNGIEANSVKYLSEEDLTPLFNQIENQFNQIQQLTIKDMNASKIHIYIKDHEKTLKVTDEFYNLIMDELVRSTTLQDPPMIYGIRYPYLEIKIGDELVLTWIVPDIASVKLRDHITGHIKLSSPNIWNTIRKLDPHKFERTGNFAVQSFKVRLNDVEFEIDNQYNRLDELVRILNQIEKEKPLTPVKRGEHPAIVIQNASGEDSSYGIFPDDMILYNGKEYKIDHFYENMVSFFSVP